MRDKQLEEKLRTELECIIDHFNYAGIDKLGLYELREFVEKLLKKN